MDVQPNANIPARSTKVLCPDSLPRRYARSTINSACLKFRCKGPDICATTRRALARFVGTHDKCPWNVCFCTCKPQFSKTKHRQHTRRWKPTSPDKCQNFAQKIGSKQSPKEMQCFRAKVVTNEATDQRHPKV